MHEWEIVLNEYNLMIEKELSNFLENEIKKATNYHDFIERLYKDIYDYIFRGGKRLASCSTLLVYKGFGKEVDGRIKAICLGIELSRHSILVHDDLVDCDELRRGSLTIHKMHSQEKSPRFGDGVAVFSGNILYALALKAFWSSSFEQNKILKVIGLFNEAFQSVNESQVLDLLFEYKKPDVDEWYRMASKRAASLFKASMLIGAVLADASEKDLTLLKEAADHIGYCFDIQDDIIDTFASKEQYGKEPGGDISKNKKPLHIIYAYKMAEPSQLEKLDKAVHKDALKNLTNVQRIISDCGALDLAKNCSKDHAKRAKKLILITAMNKETKDFFLSFIEYIENSLDWYK